MKTSPRLLLVLALACSLMACANNTYEWSANVLPPPDVTELEEKAAAQSGLATPASANRVEPDTRTKTQ